MDQEIEMKEEDDNGSNSVEDSSSDEDVDDANVIKLKSLIESQPYAYELHVQLITLCRKLRDREELNLARENMSKLFPLSPELWLDWIADEKLGLLSTFRDLRPLFERAVKDYASVSVWLEYVQWAIVHETLRPIYDILERALTAVGTHVTQGSMLWEAYREFENVRLRHLKKHNAKEYEIEEREEDIFNIFKRQLSIPLFDMDETYAEFKALYGERKDIDVKSIDYSFNKALKKLEEIQVYENTLYESEAPHYEEYKAYIEYEKKNGDPSRVQNLYERALIENCLKEDLWVDYTKFLDNVIKISDISLTAHERAVRNLPWCVQLWVNYGQAMEMYNQPHEVIKEMFENTLMSGFVKADDFKELWLAYLDYLRRRIKKEDLEAGTCDFTEIEEVFHKATFQMSKYFWGDEAEYAIMKYWIFFNAKYKKDMQTARENWKELIEHGHKEEARVWLDYANFEKLYGDEFNHRKILLQALSSVTDWPETFLDLLLTFERQEGTLESLQKSMSVMQNFKEKRMKKLEEARIEKENSKKRKRSFNKQETTRKNSPTKSESDLPVQMDSEGFKIPPPPVKLHSSEGNLKPEIRTHEETRKRFSEEEEADEKPQSKKRKAETSESHGSTVAHDSSKDDRTVFASNLSYKIEEEEIKKFFSRFGEVEEVRLVKDFKGRSKGFCYVLYKTQEDAKCALEKDREPLDERPVFISSCVDKKNNPSFKPKFKFSTGLEKNKLFIKNLPFETTEEDLDKIFNEYGTLKDVRIVTYRNGRSKGLAFVEYEEEASAANAVLKTDGLKIQEHVISVAISNPPPRKQQSRNFTPSSSISDSLGGGGGRAAKGSRGRGRTQLSLVPRSVARPAANKKNLDNSNNSLRNGQNSKSEEELKPLSNSDFAKLFTK